MILEYYLGIILLIVVIFFLFYRRSYEYRRVISDMYVVGKIKQIATEDKINLSDEFESFKKWVKNQKMEDDELHNTIEKELQERVIQPIKK